MYGIKLCTFVWMRVLHLTAILMKIVVLGCPSYFSKTIWWEWNHDGRCLNKWIKDTYNSPSGTLWTPPQLGKHLWNYEDKRNLVNTYKCCTIGWYRSMRSIFNTKKPIWILNCAQWTQGSSFEFIWANGVKKFI